MSTRSYQLINPLIEGTFNSVYDAKKPIEAADLFWKKMTEHINGYIPRFLFTIRDISSGDLNHFEIKENKNENSYTIYEKEISAKKKDFDDFINNVDKFNAKMEKSQKNKDYQFGGDDTSEDTDNDENSDSDNDSLSDDKQSDDKQSDDKQSDDKQSDDKQSGGKSSNGKSRRKRYKSKHKKSSSSSSSSCSSSSTSSSSSDFCPKIKKTSPIALFHYNTQLYNMYGDLITGPILSPPDMTIVTKEVVPIFTPIFKPYISPFVAIW